MTQLEQFEKYHSQQMNAEERAAFEKELHADPSVKLAYEEYVDMQNFLASKPNIDRGFQEIKRHRDALKESPRSASGIRYFILALFLIVLAGLAYIYFSGVQESEPQKLYAEYMKPQAISIATKGNNTRTEVLSGLEYYNQEMYEKALPLLDTLGLDEIEKPRLLLARGISEMILDKKEDSEKTLRYLVENYPDFSNDGNWYLALLQLKQGDTESAKIYLNKILASSNHYPRVQAILSKI